MEITTDELRRGNKLVMAEKQLALKLQAAVCEHACLECREFPRMGLACAPLPGRRYRECTKCYEEKAREFSKTAKGESLIKAYNEVSDRLAKWRTDISKKLKP